MPSKSCPLSKLDRQRETDVKQVSLRLMTNLFERPNPAAPPSGNRACSTLVAFGDNVVAGICGSGSRPKGRNAGKLVSEIMRRLARDFPTATADGRRIVESLVWPFVARVSRRDTWYSDKDYARFYKCVRLMAKRIYGHDKPGSVAQKYVKYWCDWYLHVCMRNIEDYPVDSAFERVPLFSGFLLTFVKRACARYDLSFIASLQKGSKRMWLSLDDVCKFASLAKHKERMQQGAKTPDSIVETIKSVSRRLFQGDGVESKFMPSSSACLQASVADGGALSIFKQFSPDLSVGLVSVNTSLERWRASEHARALEECRRTVEQAGVSRLNTVDVIAIAEPGKFRIITKMDGYLVSALQPIQGYGLQCWKNSGVSTMKDEDLTGRVDALFRVDVSGGDVCAYQAQLISESWGLLASVDYEAATDLLNKDATLAAMTGMEGHRLYQLMRLSFGRGIARYRDKPRVRVVGGKSVPVMGKDGPKYDVTEVAIGEGKGQLMGHPCSFALLCTINLAVWEHALKLYLEDLRCYTDREVRGIIKILRRLVIVNGDDMLFRCDQRLFEHFRDTAAAVGFKFSAGKNYLSSTACLINSQYFKIGDRKAHRVGYLNMKLVTGHNLKNGDGDVLPTQIGKELAKMVQLCPWSACSVPTAFARFNKDLARFGFRPNWFMPVELGGFGYEGGPVPPRYTVEQRRVAAQFVNNGDLSLYRKIGAATKITKRFKGAMGNWAWIEAGPLQEHESTDSDPWTGRLAYIERAMNAGSNTNIENVSVPRRIRRDHRLKPMSLQTIDDYRRRRKVRLHGPVVPPLQNLRNKCTWALYASQAEFLFTRSKTFNRVDNLFEFVNRYGWADILGYT